ncbi:hypothetical protein GCM10025870_23690 [Agromyces marinus]|uniref:Uncharacterized protein n=1 Tax=Agromyces marinus TaxID=1389020 RepID=A0ABM8H3I7_9MICO|nr:hypothetical protein GCM10025870_23690 [Agromyces marinus]
MRAEPRRNAGDRVGRARDRDADHRAEAVRDEVARVGDAVVERELRDLDHEREAAGHERGQGGRDAAQGEREQRAERHEQQHVEGELGRRAGAPGVGGEPGPRIEHPARSLVAEDRSGRVPERRPQHRCGVRDEQYGGGAGRAHAPIVPAEAMSRLGARLEA